MSCKYCHPGGMRYDQLYNKTVNIIAITEMPYITAYFFNMPGAFLLDSHGARWKHEYMKVNEFSFFFK